METQKKVDDLEKQVVGVTIEQKHLNDYLKKLDQTLDKLTEVLSNQTKIIAVHEQRLSTQEKNIDGLVDSINKENQFASKERNVIHGRIDVLSKDTELSIKDVLDKLTREMSNIQKENKEQHDHFEKEIGRIERFMWMIAGGSGVVGFMIASFGKSIITSFFG